VHKELANCAIYLFLKRAHRNNERPRRENRDMSELSLRRLSAP
jgi:hypothetical protein